MSQHDSGVGEDSASVGATMLADDKGKWSCHTTLKKFWGDSTDEADCYETLEIDGNILVTGGVSALMHRLIGDTSVGPFDNANAAIGVSDGGGTSAADEATADTDLAGTTNKLRKGMDATFPQHTDTTTTVSSKTMTFRATFATNEANYVWREWGVFNSVATTGTGLNRMLNRKKQALGEKVLGATWQLTVAVTIN